MIAKAMAVTEIDGALAVDRALDFASQKVGGRSRSDALDRIKAGNLDAYLYFRWALATEAVRQAAEMCDEIERGFIFLENRCESVPGEPVLVGLVASKKSAALQALVESIGEAVKRETGERIPALFGFDAVIVFEVIDAQEINTRKGLGALVGSIHEPPIQVWPQQ